MSPPHEQQTAPLRAFTHLATICVTLCVDAAVFVSAHSHQLYLLLLAVYFAVSNAFLLVCSQLASAFVSSAFRRLNETRASTAASAL
eukprot:3416785-Pleurochrysis_carterae.AAC.1